MNETLQLIQSRKSIRKFNDEKLTREELETIVEAGRWAPTGGNSQTVHFTVITNPEILETLRQLVQKAFAKMEVTEGMYASKQNSIRASKTGNYVYDYHTQVLVVISNKKGYPNGLADCGCVIENMMIQAASMNIGSCWINQLHWLDEDEEIRGYLKQYGILEDETICGSVALGKYDSKPGSLPRKGMEVTWL